MLGRHRGRSKEVYLEAADFRCGSKAPVLSGCRPLPIYPETCQTAFAWLTGLAEHQDQLFRGDNKVVSIPRLPHWRIDRLVDGLDGHFGEMSGCQKTLDFGLFV